MYFLWGLGLIVAVPALSVWLIIMGLGGVANAIGKTELEHEDGDEDS